MSIRRVACVVALAVAASSASAAPQGVVQLTNGGGKASTVVRVGPRGSRFVAVQSSADLTPMTPGNADGSPEAYLFDVKTGKFTQATNYVAAAGLDFDVLDILADGSLLLASQADLTPGAPGHDASSGGYATYVYSPAARKAPASLVQITPSAARFPIELAQPFAGDRKILFNSSEDMTGAGANVDGSRELFLYDRDAKTLAEITAGTGDAYGGPLDAKARVFLIESASDLAGAGRNADGSVELFLYDATSRSFEQLTNEPAGVDWSVVVELDFVGRMIVLQRRDSSSAVVITETWLLDLKKRTFDKLTSASSGGVNEVKGVSAGSSLLVLNTRSDIAPALGTAPGNSDHSLEVFTLDLRSHAIVQLTASSADASCRAIPRAKGLPAVVTSKGDLAPGAPGNTGGVQQVFFLPVGRKGAKPVQITNGATDSSYAGLDDKGAFVAIRSKADLVPGQNTDHSQEIFVVNLKGKPVIRQMTSGDKDVTFSGFLHDNRSFLVTTKADLAPGKPGNSGAATEVYRVFYR